MPQFTNITEPQIRRALNLPPVEVQAAIEDKVRSCMDILKARYPQLTDPEIRYDLKGRTAGYATRSYIRINVDLLYTSHKDDMIQQTVPHELAHVAQMQLYPRSKPHGREWAYFCHLLGIPPRRCHSYETTPARQRKPLSRSYIYRCNCKTHHMTQIIHRRAQAGTDYYCRNCGSYLTYVGTSLDKLVHNG